MAGAREEKEMRAVIGCEARDFILFCGIYHRGGTQSMFAEQVNAWKRHQNKVWWHSGPGRGFSQQPDNQGDQVAP